MNELFGYAGKILRINLSVKTTEIIPTKKYLPDYIGGRIMANKIFWDEVKEAVPAFDPRNRLIYMTGPCAGTGLPISGRAVITGISAKNLPEQYTHSSIGGYFGTMLKWAGYDGFILEGKAEEHTYVFIKDEKVEFLNADSLWGKYVIETQQEIFKLHGPDAYSLVIGPAGENLHRCASIATHADSVAAKTGFGAVMGSKNLKAIAVVGTGSIQPGNVESVLRLRNLAGDPKNAPSPLIPQESIGFPFGRDPSVPAPEGLCRGGIACNQGCNTPCMVTQYFVDNPINHGEKISMVGKCIDGFGKSLRFDSHSQIGACIHSHRQETFGSYKWMIASNIDPDDPDLQKTLAKYPGDYLGLPKFGQEYAVMVSWLCNEYGLDKWDIIIWYLSWLGMCRSEGLLDGLNIFKDGKLEDPQFIKAFIDDMVYRKTPMGELFAEGMARAIRKLGKEKYGNSIYHGRINTVTGDRLDIPVSFESTWGECSHWQGRGFQGCHKFEWVAVSLTDMVGSRDEVCGQHFHDWVESWEKYKDDPCHSPIFIQKVIENNQLGELKDSLLLCEYKSPTPYWPEMEVELYRAATGRNDVTTQELHIAAERGRLLERAIFMRNHGRTRDMEVKEIFPYLTYPDPFGETMSWEEWNDAVDLYYDTEHWDRETGWPYRSTWEKYGLSDIANEMESIGKLPKER